MCLSSLSTILRFFLDETGSDKRNAHRCYAYSWRGKPARAHKLLVRGQRMNAIAFMSVDGLLDCHIEEENVDGDVSFFSNSEGTCPSYHAI